jgi:hypothetical protein
MSFAASLARSAERTGLDAFTVHTTALGDFPPGVDGPRRISLAAVIIWL